MTLVALKCPNCGALIPRETLNCEYCGASLSLTPDKTALVPQTTSNCPKCANPVTSGAWFCPECGEVLIKDVQHLREIQRKFAFTQENLRKTVLISNKHLKTLLLGDKLEETEFVYYLFHNKGIFTNKYYFVTDKKLASVDAHKNLYWQAAMSEIITVGKPYFVGTRAPFTHWLKVQSFKETFAFDFGSSRTSQASAWNFYRALNKAMSDYTLQKRDIRAILWSLKIP